jgi:hypothetical protein
MQMKKKQYQALSAALHMILINEWDPIGMRHEPRAQTEYDTYIPGIIRILQDGADRSALRTYLQHTEIVNMGMQGNLERKVVVQPRMVACSWL